MVKMGLANYVKNYSNHSNLAGIIFMSNKNDGIVLSVTVSACFSNFVTDKNLPHGLACKILDTMKYDFPLLAYVVGYLREHIEVNREYLVANYMFFFCFPVTTLGVDQWLRIQPPEPQLHEPVQGTGGVGTTTSWNSAILSVVDKEDTRRIYSLRLNVVICFCKYMPISEPDRIDAYKGLWPCAMPEPLDEHSVFKLSNFCQGIAESYARSTELELKSNLKLENHINLNLTQHGKSVCYKGKKTKGQTLCHNWYNVYSYSDTAHIGTMEAGHVAQVVVIALMHDIELNPGPDKNVRLTILTLNCRGLGNMDKFRLLLNKIYKLKQKGSVIALLQETMVVSDNYLALAWRGKYVLTPGTGNSKGCITLLSENVVVESIKHYGNRGHLFVTSDEQRKKKLVCNIYAPLGYDDNKSNFFNDVFNDILEWEGDVILGGDFNVTLYEQDRHCRGATIAERRLADLVINYTKATDLHDCWEGYSGFTWQKGRKMSKLDRVYTRLDGYTKVDVTTNWSYTQSDHACVSVKLQHMHQKVSRNEHVKLDDKVVNTKETLSELREYLLAQLDTACLMAPHMLLEFAKMTVRTKALEIMARLKKKENEKLIELNNEINKCTQLLTRYLDMDSQIILTRELEELHHAKNNILAEQGAQLAMRAKTKWYNEGERSNKYFLNLLKHNNQKNEMLELEVEGNRLTDEGSIRREVTGYYSTLYNQDMSRLVMDDNFLDAMFLVEDGMDDFMCAPVTLNELWLTLKPTRATTPGPDRMSNTYLKKLWDIIGPIILDAWNYSVANGILPLSHCTSLLRLIPKVGKDTKQVKNWRPITLSNCDHKLIAGT